MSKDKEFKAKIVHVNNYEVTIENDSICHNCETQEKAKILAKKLEKEAKEEYDKRNSYESERRKHLLDLDNNICNYIEYLKKRMWSIRNNKYTTEEEKIIIKKEREQLKIIINNLEGFYHDTLRISWYSGSFGDNYTITKTKKGDEE